MEATTYPGFNFDASQLSAFALSVDTFIIALKNGNIVHHSPKDIEHFKKWLVQNRVRDISVDKGHHSLNSKS